MLSLNLPKYEFKFKSSKNRLSIFDIIRKKFVVLNPEEWVRQHIVHYLIEELNYPISLISVEKKITFNKLTKRTDILVFNSQGKPDIIVECKAPTIKISQNAFDQIAQYNMKLNANILMVTNGLQHYYCSMDKLNERYIFLENIPHYSKK